MKLGEVYHWPKKTEIRKYPIAWLNDNELNNKKLIDQRRPCWYASFWGRPWMLLYDAESLADGLWDIPSVLVIALELLRKWSSSNYEVSCFLGGAPACIRSRFGQCMQSCCMNLLKECSMIKGRSHIILEQIRHRAIGWEIELMEVFSSPITYV